MRVLGTPTRRALTFLEFLLALAVTALVALAISGMLTTVAMGQQLRRDNRAFVIRTHALKSRLAAYIGPSRCLLKCDGTNLVLWLNDSRQSGSVHASEIRWITFDSSTETLSVHYVSFPDDWTDVAKALEDHEYPYDADWSAVWASYDANDLIAQYTLLDGLYTVSVTTDEAAPVDSRQVVYDLSFATEGEALPQTVSATIFRHLPPTY
ncbi:MAG: PulJ/GspJ family protein [Planctomycetota bacterium]|jgi:hypothetical protein